MDILTGLLIAFLIHTLDNAWVNWLNYRMATHQHQQQEEDNNNNGVKTMDKMGFTQGWQLKDGDGED